MANPQLKNPYTDTAQTRGKIVAALKPQIRAGEDKVTSLVNPYMRGKTGAALQRSVYQPAQAKIADYEIGQAQKAQDYEANLPFKTASYTGKLGGVDTLQGRTTASNLATADVQRGLLPQQFELQKSATTGQYNNKDTLAAQLGKGGLALQTAGVTGQYGGQDTLANRLAQQQYGINVANLTGQYGGQDTLAGRQFEAGQAERTELSRIANAVGLSSPEELELLATIDPERFARIIQTYRPSIGF